MRLFRRKSKSRANELMQHREQQALHSHPPPESFDGHDFASGFARIHNAFFGRDPDVSAIENFVARAERGLTDREIAAEFAQSAEYLERKRHKLFVQPGHYYSPIANIDEATEALNAVSLNPQPLTLPGITIDFAAMLDLWNNLLPATKSQPFPDDKADEFRYYFSNPNFAFGDGVIWHAMIRHLRPRRVIEIGSGFSSANLIETNERYFSGSIELTFIEPFPELLLELIGSMSDRVMINSAPVQKCDLALFKKLEAGDVLFIDSTHVLRTGGDVCFELFEVLPILNEGVIVHIHDMFWPFEYPREWAVDQNRSWNEIYAVRAFLTGNSDWEILMFNDYMAKVAQAHVAATLPRFLTNPGGGLYLRKRAPR